MFISKGICSQNVFCCCCALWRHKERDGGGDLCYNCREKLPPALRFLWDRDAVRNYRRVRVCSNRRAHRPFTRIFWKSPSDTAMDVGLGLLQLEQEVEAGGLDFP